MSTLGDYEFCLKALRQGQQLWLISIALTHCQTIQYKIRAMAGHRPNYRRDKV